MQLVLAGCLQAAPAPQPFLLDLFPQLQRAGRREDTSSAGYGAPPVVEAEYGAPEVAADYAAPTTPKPSYTTSVKPCSYQPPTTTTTTTTTTAAPAATCTTTGGPAAGSNCVFPFTFSGTTYTGCAEWIYGGQPEGTRWCSTQVDPATGEHVNNQGNYGFCPTTCVSASPQSARVRNAVVFGRRRPN